MRWVSGRCFRYRIGVSGCGFWVSGLGSARRVSGQCVGSQVPGAGFRVSGRCAGFQVGAPGFESVRQVPVSRTDQQLQERTRGSIQRASRGVPAPSETLKRAEARSRYTPAVFGVESLGFSSWVLGFRVWILGFRV